MSSWKGGNSFYLYSLFFFSMVLYRGFNTARIFFRSIPLFHLSQIEIHNHNYICDQQTLLGNCFKNNQNKYAHTCVPCYSNKAEEMAALVTKGYFDNMKNRDKKTFMEVLNMFEDRDPNRRGHVEFIYAALKEMEKFGVLRDMETYKKLLDVFPKGRFIPNNMFQIEFMHYPKHQQCAIDILDQMEENGAIPDEELGDILINTFGKWAHPVRKYMRMMYWMPKFNNISPWPLPKDMPNESLELAMIAIKQIMSVDLQSQIDVYKTLNLEDSLDDTWIVSGQSPTQRHLVELCLTTESIHVEGAFRLWMRNTCVNYFILRAVAKPREKKHEDEDDVSKLNTWLFGQDPDKSLAKPISVHEQEDGIILSVCATGSSSRDSLLSWIRFLEKINPKLKEIPVLFTLKSPIGEVVQITNVENNESKLNV